jgi:hypothetical protein
MLQRTLGPLRLYRVSASTCPNAAELVRSAFGLSETFDHVA